MARFVWMLATLALVTMAGCTTAGADASIEFDGSGNGVDADSADCKGDGTLAGSGTVDDGELTVRVLVDGDEVFQETYTGEIALEGRAIDGKSGDWTLEATRSGDELLTDFDGSYKFRLDC